jgi:hypothetical protein
MSTETITLSRKDQIKAELKEIEKAEKLARDKPRREYVADKDNYLQHSASKFKSLHNEMAELKEYSIREANKLYDRMYELNGRETKKVKSFTIKNEEDTVKITVDRQERFEFTEEATVHIQHIKEIFKNKFEQRHKGMYSLIDGLLMKGSKKEYDPKLLSKARRQVRELGDAELIEVFDKLEDCQRVVGSSMYCRLHARDEKGKYQDVTLQFSSL